MTVLFYTAHTELLLQQNFESTERTCTAEYYSKVIKITKSDFFIHQVVQIYTYYTKVYIYKSQDVVYIIKNYHRIIKPRI